MPSADASGLTRVSIPVAIETGRGLLVACLRATILAAAPTPPAAAKLTRAQLRALLARAGRQRGLDAEADRLQTVFRGQYLHQLPQVEDALGHQARALLRQLDAACANAEELAAAAKERFEQHPDAEIITSRPGLGSLTAPECSPRSATTDPASPSHGR